MNSKLYMGLKLYMDLKLYMNLYLYMNLFSSFTVVVKFSPPGISQSFVGQVPFGGAFARMSLLDRSNSGGD